MRYVLTLSILVVAAFGVGFVLDQYSLEHGNVAARTALLAASGVLAQNDAYYGSDNTYYGSDNNYYSQDFYSSPQDTTYNSYPDQYTETPQPSRSSYYDSSYNSYYDNSYQPYNSYNSYNSYDPYYNSYYYPTSYYDTIYMTPSPWYVQTFPGIGRLAQYIIPGQINPTPVHVTAPSPAPRPVANPQPSCWISADPTQVVNGGTSVLSWSSFNATRATLSDLGDVSVTGERTLHGLTATQTYTLQIFGAGGSNICYTRVNVAAIGPTPSCVISVFPSTISRGSSASLSWGSMNASVATLGGVGSVELQGGRSVFPAYSSDYTLTVSSSGKQSSCTTHLTVQ